MGVRTRFIISNQAVAPHVSIWKAFMKTHHLLIKKSHLETCQFACLELCVRWNIFYVNGGAYRFWAQCVLGNVDIYMLVVAVMVVSFDAL